MAMSEQKAKDLAAIEPPDSIRNLLKFLDDLVVRDVQLPIGIGGRAAETMGAAIQARHTGSAVFSGLMEAHSVSTGDIQKFLRWLHLWHDKRAEMEVLKAPVPEPVVTHTHSTSKEVVYVTATTGTALASSVSGMVSPTPTPTPRPAEATVKRPSQNQKPAASPSQSKTTDETKEGVKPAVTEAKASYRTEQPDVITRAWKEPVSVESAKAEKGLSASQLIWGANALGGAYAIGALSQHRPAPLLASQVAPSERFEPVFERRTRPEPEVTVTIHNPPARRTKEALQHGERTAPDSTPVEIASKKPGPSRPTDGGPPRKEDAETLPVHVIQPLRHELTGRKDVASEFLYHQVLGKAIFPAMAASLTPTFLSPIRMIFTGKQGGERAQSPTNSLNIEGTESEPIGPADRSLAATNRGELTLIAPDLQVASEESEQGGAAVSLSWKELVQGMGELSEGDVEVLNKVLPKGAQAIYPALPEGSLGKNSVNVPLAPSAVQNLLHSGYGARIGGGSTPKSKRSIEGTPAAKPMKGKIVPTRPPMGDKASVVGGENSPLGVAGEGQARRTGVLDFMGLPVRLAPSLGGKSELQEEVAARTGLSTAPSGSPIRPRDFGPVRSKIFPTFQSLEAEPEKAAWQRAGPSFGMRSADPISVLTPDVRRKSASAEDPIPQISGGVHSAPPASRPSSTGGHAFGTAPDVVQPASQPTAISGLRRPSLPVEPQIDGAATGPGPISMPTIPSFEPIAAASPTAMFGTSSAPIAPRTSPSIPNRSVPGAIGQVTPRHSPDSPIGTLPALSTKQSEPTSRPPLSSAPQLAMPSRSASLPTAPAITHSAPSTTSAQPRPTMLYAAAPARGQVQPKVNNVAVQASRGNVMTQQTQTMQQTQKSQEPTLKSTEGKKAADVQLMANEVWAILKRRIAAERDRAGRW